jgi:hypothetical protein
VREEAMQIGRLTKHPEPTVASSPRYRNGVRLQMQFRLVARKRQQNLGERTKHPVLVKLRPVVIFLQATVSIFLILAAIYIVFKENIR